MFRKSLWMVVGGLLMTALVFSCGDDDTVVPKRTGTSGPYKDLTEKDDVLYNLQLLYPQRDVTEYDRLLEDDDYIFYFFEGDGGAFTQYTKQQELQTLRNMADDTRPDRVLSIELTLQYPKGEWTGIDATDPKYEGETWYQKVVTYRMTVRAAPNMTYTCDGIKAQFTIRLGKDRDGSDIWRIIRWRDDLDAGPPKPNQPIGSS